MANVNTGELLNFQDYSPEHNGRSARIDVEAVHTNQYNNVVTNSNYTFEEPKTVVEEQETAPQTNHNFWTIEYYQKYFDVQTSEVLERIVSSVLPQKVSRNYFDERIKGKPDLYGPIWISVTLIFTIAVSGNIANYLQNANKEVHWRYNYHLVSYAATAIFCYVWLVPLALWAALKWSVVPDGQDEIETQASASPTMISLFCLYGYSLSIYIPVAILWTIQVSWLQWLFVLMAALVSGAVLIFWLLPALKKSKYSLILIGSILGFHFLLASGFMLYFFHVPNTVDPTTVVTNTTVKV
ncbi:protein YIPF2 [Danaus plexippus]|uniref:Protein YIPF n=1 Tax=Danaus plexippus plexippus TaxID=278856 RepID=A0A212FNC7_DANPL|nr:protein YIPF2 [Danaus plexippus]OWR55237.1 YIPF1 protein [Danaus plexippus plexippus]